VGKKLRTRGDSPFFPTDFPTESLLGFGTDGHGPFRLKRLIMRGLGLNVTAAKDTSRGCERAKSGKRKKRPLMEFEWGDAYPRTDGVA
jgi:hypothetical protein